MLKKLASSPKLADPGLDKHGNMVFFDVVGYFMVHYPQRVGVIINCALVAAVMFKVIRKVLGMSSSGMVNVLKRIMAGTHNQKNQTGKTLIRLLQKQSDLGLLCLSRLSCLKLSGRCKEWIH